MHLYFRKVRKKEKKITHGGGFSLAQWDSSAAAHTSRLDAELLDAVGAARRRGDPRLPGVARPPRSSSPAMRSRSSLLATGWPRSPPGRAAVTN